MNLKFLVKEDITEKTLKLTNMREFFEVITEYPKSTIGFCLYFIIIVAMITEIVTGNRNNKN